MWLIIPVNAARANPNPNPNPPIFAVDCPTWVERIRNIVEAANRLTLAITEEFITVYSRDHGGFGPSPSLIWEVIYSNQDYIDLYNELARTQREAAHYGCHIGISGKWLLQP